jgi:hypothetical protein
LNKNIPKIGMFFAGGEGGIRTREPLWVTRFPSVRAKPDYATSPFQIERGDYTMGGEYGNIMISSEYPASPPDQQWAGNENDGQGIRR